MRAIILSAGKGMRMQDFNNDLPKVLLPILNKPMLLWNIELLKKYGITDIAINTHYLAEKIKEYLEDGRKFGVNIKYSYESELLGTSGALNNFREFFTNTFLVVYGDVLSNMDLSRLIKFHNDKKASATLVVRKTDHPLDSDIVQLDKNDGVVGVYHKPGTLDFGDIGNAAWYILEPDVFNYITPGHSDFIKDVFPRMIADKKIVYGYMTTEFIKDAGTPERLMQVQKFLKEILAQ
ncbi:nucleotidyltransferase family protein [Candidatus Pacearchaeota archaeon]|nr:nucleotidyltransferase family protein [Candidatus Pacearchaeota archaeon]